MTSVVPHTRDDFTFHPSTPYGTGFEKESFPTHPKVSTTLSELITEDSRFFFEIMQIDYKFLIKSADNWLCVNSYQRGLQNVDTLNVMNDCTKRSVKQCVDFFLVHILKSIFKMFCN